MSMFLTSADGTQIAYEAHGPEGGPTLIEVQGATAYRAMLNTAPALAEATGYRALSYDRRGRGESGDTPPYAVEREIEDLGALVATATGPVYLIGESSGAVLALEAARAGVPVAGLVLYEPPFIVDGERPPLPPDYVERLDALIAEGDRLGAFKYFSVVAIGMPEGTVDGIENGPWWPLVEPAAHTLAYDGHLVGPVATGSPETLERYRDVTVPALVFVGSETFPYMQAAARAISGVLPDAEMVRLDGADHQMAVANVAPGITALVERTRP
jgi:pimeloyl-ACP methyl ester carboxylesterase